MFAPRRVVHRYLFAEVAGTWLVVAGVLLFLTLGLGFARFIADAAAGDLPVDTVLNLAVYSALENSGIVLPISVLLAILLTVGRLCRDNEMAALFAGGVGLGTIYKPFFTLGIAVALLAGALSLWAAPRAERAMDELTAASATSALQSLSAGRFRTLIDGDAVFYAQSKDAESGVMRNVFIRVAHEGRGGEPTQTVVTAERARQRRDEATGSQILVLENGWRYEGRPGQADYRVVQFGEHGVRLTPPAPEVSGDVDMQTSTALAASDAPAAAAELQARLSVPVSILVLTLLALPLGRVPPRTGRYGRVIAGVLLYVVYVNMVHLATVWIETGALPPVLGVWWVHAAALGLAVALVMREQGLFARRRAAP